MTVGAIVHAVDVGQSTVSAHLRRLAELEFVFVEHVGTASLYRVNDECLTAFRRTLVALVASILAIAVFAGLTVPGVGSTPSATPGITAWS